jgi:hypothetical protein
MSVVAPPPQDELEALIREARARQRRRWLGAAAVVALLAGAALGLNAILAGGAPSRSESGGPASSVRTVDACGVRGLGVRILDRSGRTLYREPGHYVHPNAGFPTIRCSGSTIWGVWFNGVGMMKEAYVGARSLDAGHTWKLVFSEPFFGVKAPHALDSYLGVWRLGGSRDAYFTGSCPACDYGKVQGTISLWVTKDAGRTFRMYKVPELTGYAPVRLLVSGQDVRISAKRFAQGVEPPRKTATVHLG